MYRRSGNFRVKNISCKIFVALNFRGPDHPRNYFNGLPVPCVKNGYRKEISLLFIFVVKKISCVKFSWFGATTKFF